MQTIMLGFAALGAVALVASALCRLLRVRDQAETLLGLGFVLLLPALAIRAHAYFNPPSPEQIFEQQFGPRDPATLYGARFVRAEQTPGYFDLVVDAQHEAGERWMIDGLLDDGLMLGRWMARQASRVPVGDVVITMRAALVDRYGNESRHEVLTLRWPGEDWARINWSKISPVQFAELASVPMAFPAVRPAISSWCAFHGSRWRACPATF